MGKRLKVMEEYNIPYIPYDILVNILKRLGVKSLIRFQCVCKDWKNLIKSPSFIQDHLHHTAHQSPLLLLSWINRSKSSTLDKPMGLLDLHNKPALEIQKPPPLIDSISFEIVDSSNGLVCLHVDDKIMSSLSHGPKKNGTASPYFLLWNPATRQFRKVPRTTRESNGRCLGFGFTPIDNDYKIVEIHSGRSYVVNPVEVYSLNSGAWKEIEFENIEGTSLCCRLGSVIVNGVMYWLNASMKDAVSIDLTRQVCISIPLPQLKGDLTKNLLAYKNKLALAVAGGQCDLIYLWEMEKDMGRWILTAKYSDNPYPMSLTLIPSVVFWRNDIVFCPHHLHVMDYAREHLWMLDVTGKKIHIWPVTEQGSRSTCGAIYNYVESLVSIRNTNHDDPKF